MADFAVSVRLSADGKGLVGEMREATGALDKLAASEGKVAAGANTMQAATAKAETSEQALSRTVQQVTADIQRQTTEAVQSAQAMTRIGSAMTTAGNAAARARAGQAQLGQQIQDITIQAQMGTSAFMIFGQQFGQVATAASLMGGKIGALGTFLAGPWGASIQMAVIGLGVLFSATRNAADAQDGHAKAAKTNKQAIEDLAKASGLGKKSAEEEMKATIAAVDAKIKDAIATRKQIAARIELARAMKEAGAAPGGEEFATGALVGALAEDHLAKKAASNAATIAALEKQISLNRGFFESSRAAAAATDVSAAATQRYERAVTSARAQFEQGAISQQQLTAKLIAAERQRDATTKAATDAQRTSTREMRDGTEAVDAYAKSLEDLIRTVNGVGSVLDRLNLPSASEIIRAQEAEATQSRTDSGLGGIVEGIEARLGNEFAERTGHALGESAASSFRSDALIAAEAIGQIVGGKAGGVLRSVMSTVQLASGGKTGSPFGDAFGKELKGALSPLKSSFDKVFGSGAAKGIAGAAGTAFGGAAVGGAASSIAGMLGIKQSGTGAGIGGALGALSGIPGGSIIGGLLGGTLGGALKTTKSGSATLSLGADGLGVGAVGGNSAKFKEAASGALQGVISNLNSIAEMFGGSLSGTPSVSLGVRHGDYRVDTTGRGVTKKAKGAIDFDQDQAGAISYATIDALKDGLVTGVSDAIQKALKSSDNLDKALAEAQKVKGIEDLLAGAGSAFKKVFQDFERQSQERLNIARKYGFDLVKIEEVNAKQRAALFEQIQEQQTGSLRAFVASLTSGGLAEGDAVQRRAARLAEIEKVRADAVAGKEGANDLLAELLARNLQETRNDFGTAGSAYGADRTSAEGIARTVIDQANQQIEQARKDAENATAAKLEEANRLANENNDQNARMLAAFGYTNEQLAAINATLSGLGSGFGSGVNAAAMAALIRNPMSF